jgi:hypothetical protein
MKEYNEYINLRLYSLDQALGIIDCLFDNNYTYRNYSEEETIRERVKKDIIKSFTGKPISKKWYTIFYIEMDNEIRDFVITTKVVDIIDIRTDKIIKLKKGI